MMKVAALSAVLLLALAACDNSIQPMVEGSEGTLFIYGFLDSAADSQFVRLDGVRIAALGDRPDLSTVRLSSTDDSGETVDWIYQGATFEDGSTGHNFLGLFRPVEGGRYALQARSTDGRVTEASTTIPVRPPISPDPPRGDTLQIVQKIRLSGLERSPLRVIVQYEVQAPESPEAVSVSVDYGDRGSLSADGWDFDVFLKRDHPTVMAGIARNVRDRDVALLSIGVRAELLSAEWDEPHTARNITGGRGFFGAVGRYDLGWTLEPAVVATIGFVDGQ
ncbi:MAG: hypothetical protein ACI9W4_000021 [Rhodothermales bacterium]|jgi:hypothetical protein